MGPLDEHWAESATGEYKRRIWLMRGGDEAQRLCVFLDAEFYLKKIDAPAIIGRLQEEGAIPAVSCVFVSNEDNASRHRDFICSESYSRFIVEDVVTRARGKLPGIRDKGHVVCGLSLSGLAAGFLTLSHPEVFPIAIAQSGSFWWNDGWFAKNVPTFPPADRRYWLSVGDQETESGVSHAPSGMRQDQSQIAGVESAVSALQGSGAAVEYNRYAGGHEIRPWAEELPGALTWVLGS